MLTRLLQQLTGGTATKTTAPPPNIYTPVSPIGSPFERVGMNAPAQPAQSKGRLNSYRPVNGIEAMLGPEDTGTVSTFGSTGPTSVINKRLPADFGVNKPLTKPAFFGYHNNQPLYCGQNLYISC